EAQKRLRDTPGVTALVYDQRCAAEKRRLRKRGKLPDPATRVYINEAVCEGCGDCGAKSNCLSVHPVETEFGRKTQIHQSSCNKDYSCLSGDCPSFLTVTPLGRPRKKERGIFTVERPLPDPALRVPTEASICMLGIGGTGVVTVNQLLGTAALLEGKHVRGLDQTGLSPKGGPVVSHLKIGPGARDASNKIAAGGLVAAVNRTTRKDENVFLDALGLAEELFGDHMAANLIVLGAAYQAGAIPVAAEAIEEAVALNGVAVAMNTHAFRVGRLLVVDPERAETVTRRRIGAVEAAPAPLAPELAALLTPFEGETRRLLSARVPGLVECQTRAY